MSVPSEYPHITLDPQGKAHLGQTRMKVSHLATFHVHHGWSAQELHWQYPEFSLAEIHSALAYYYDHKEALDKERRSDEEAIGKLAATTSAPFSRAELESRAASDKSASA